MCQNPADVNALLNWRTDWGIDEVGVRLHPGLS
jgi:hypothetical protein